MKRQLLFVFLLAAAALLAVACSGNLAPIQEPAAYPGDEPAGYPGQEGEQSMDPEQAEEVAGAALEAARQLLAQTLNIDAESVQLDKIEDQEWSDSCLGLGGPAESCLQAMTPGFRITFLVNGQEYHVRTDVTGESVRVEEFAPGAASPEDLAEAPVAGILDNLSTQFDLLADQVEIISARPQEWGDACLGLPEEGEVCAQVVTPGYLVIVRAGERVYEVRTNEDASTIRVQETADPGAELPFAAVAAREALAQQLGLAVESIQVTAFERADWPDACLGLPQPDEVCAQVITPGWQITLEAEGQMYTARADQAGDVVRLEDLAAPLPEPGSAPDAALAAARGAVAKQAGLAPEAVEIVSSQPMEWPDACLGLPQVDEACAEIITPGWLILLNAGGQTFEVHTDQGGAAVRIASDPPIVSPGVPSAPPVITYSRSGGIEGEELVVKVYADGTIERTTGVAGPDQPVEAAFVSPAEVDMLLAALRAAGFFELEASYLPEDTCCDRFLYLLTVQDEQGTHTVELLQAADNAPDTIYESISLVEQLIGQAFLS